MLVRYQREYRHEPIGLVDQVPWAWMVSQDEGIISTIDDGLLASYYVEPFDLGSLTKSTQAAIKLQLNESVKWMGSGWGIWLHERHVPFTKSYRQTWTNPVAQLLDDEHCTALEATGRLWTTDVYMSIWRRAQTKRMRQWKRWVYHEPEEMRHPASMAQQELSAGLHRLEDQMHGACRALDRLDMSTVLTYLHSCVSTTSHPVAIPSAHHDLGAYLTDCDLHTGTLPILGPVDDDGYPAHGGVYVRCLSMSADLPPTLTPSLMRGLQQLRFEYDMVSRWLPMDRQVAEKVTTDQQRNLMSAQKSAREIAYEALKRQEKEPLNTHLGKQAKQVDVVRDEMLSQVHTLGYYTGVWVVRHADLDEANRRIRAIQSVLHRHGCMTHDESLNAVEAFLSTLPGNTRQNLERHQLTSLNWADLGAWHRPWGGVSWNTHFNGPALTQGVTDGCTPCGVDLHVGDLGHVIQVGMFGSAKSTTNNWLAVQSTRRTGRDVVILDIGGSARATTLCMGGDYWDVAAGDVQIQVMAYLDDDEEYPSIYQWLVNRVKESGLPWDPDIGTYLMGGMEEMRREHTRPRTLQEYLYVLTAHSNRMAALGSAQYQKRAEILSLMAPKVIAALQPFARGGIFGKYMDADSDGLMFSSWMTFEIEGLLERKELYPAMLELIFHRLKRRRRGHPIHYQFNEAWHYFSHPVFLDLLANDMPSWRRENVYALFSTQSIAHLLGNRLTPFLKQSCLTRMFLADGHAMDRDVLPLYRDMELSEEEVQQHIAMGRRGSVYLVRPDGRRLVDLHLQPMTLAICGATSKDIQPQIDEILAEHGSEHFAEHWLKHCGFEVSSLARERACVAS